MEKTFNQVSANPSGNGQNDYFTGLMNTYCEVVFRNKPYKSFMNKYFIDLEEGRYQIMGDGIRIISMRDILATIRSDCDSFCERNCKSCQAVVEEQIIKLREWKGSCFKINKDQLRSAFCNLSLVDQLALLGNQKLEKSRELYLDEIGIKEFENLNNYWLDGVQGQQLKIKKLALGIYSTILEMIQGTTRFNKYQDKFSNNITEIDVVISASKFMEMREELASYFSPLIGTCAKLGECEINFVLAKIQKSDAIVFEKEAIVLFESFNGMEDFNNVPCSRLEYYKNFKEGLGIDESLNVVSLILEKTAEQEAEEIVKAINEFSPNDLKIENGNTEVIAKTTLEDLIKSKIPKLEKTTLDFVFTNFKAPTETEDGSIDFIVNIKKSEEILKTSNKKTAKIIFKMVRSKNKK